MKKIYQTIHGKKGNCLSACVASLLDIGLEEVPVFVNGRKNDGWLKRLKAFLRARGYDLLCIDDDHCLEEIKGNVIAIGVSAKCPAHIRSTPKRAEWLHATIWKNNKIVHDPSEKNRKSDKFGFIGEPILYLVLVKKL